jgi:hypothetical protein
VIAPNQSRENHNRAKGPLHEHASAQPLVSVFRHGIVTIDLFLVKKLLLLSSQSRSISFTSCSSGWSKISDLDS